MLTASSGQIGFLDAAVLMGPLPEGSFYALLAEHGDRIVRDEDFAACYSAGVGRPSIPPSQLAMVMLLQHRTGLSDREAMGAVVWDLRWKVALGLAVDHPGWHPTSLTKFRARLLLHGAEQAIFEATLRRAEELGLLEGTAEQVMDSTPMLGAAATQDTVRLVRHGVRGLIDAVAAQDAEAGRVLADGLEFDYRRPAEKPDCRWREKAERQRMLTRVAQDAERALQAVGQTDGLLADEAIAEAYELLRALIGQDFDIDEDGVPRLHQGTRSGRILSTVDPQMRHGRKSSSQRFDGYKISAAATTGPEPLITAVSVCPADEVDGEQAAGLIERQVPRRRPARVLGDTAYGNGPVRATLADHGVEVLAPVPEGKPSEEGRLGKADFAIDTDAGSVTCPHGQAVAITTTPSGARWANFSAAVCGGCPLKDSCCPGRRRRQIHLVEHEEHLQAGRRALADPEQAEHLRRTRPKIERLLGLIAHRYGARKSRYIGTDKAELHASIAASLVNLNPIARHLPAPT